MKTLAALKAAGLDDEAGRLAAVSGNGQSKSRAIGWLGALEGGCLREEPEGFSTMLDVVVERGVE